MPTKPTDEFPARQFPRQLISLTVLAAVTIGLMLSLSGCNTMQGLGKDVEKAGEAIQKSTK